MQCVSAFFLIICFAGFTSSLDNCKGKSDGFYEVSCLSMVKCTGGKLERIFCPPFQVIDTSDHKCKPMIKVKPPCGKLIDCSKMKDGTYPDLDQQCRSYYTCLGGKFLGHNICPNSLVFNEKLKLCDFKGNVLKPCGNKVKDA